MYIIPKKTQLNYHWRYGMEKFIISKKDLNKYFKNRRIITKDELEKYYKKGKNLQKKLSLFYHFSFRKL